MVARGREMKRGLPGGGPGPAESARPHIGRRGQAGTQLDDPRHVQRPNEHRQSGVTRRGTGAGTATGLHQGIAYWQNEERRESRRGDRRSLKELGFGDRKH